MFPDSDLKALTLQNIEIQSNFCIFLYIYDQIYIYALVILSIHFTVPFLIFFFYLVTSRKNGNGNCIFIVCPRSRGNICREFLQRFMNVSRIDTCIDWHSIFFSQRNIIVNPLLKILRLIINCRELKSLFF